MENKESGDNGNIWEIKQNKNKHKIQKKNKNKNKYNRNTT